jgi:hypothetical protein
MKEYFNNQINKIRSLGDNWYEEGVGKSYLPDGLDWFVKEFSEHYSQDFPNIYIHPSYDDNTLNIEWHSNNNFSPSMYVNVENQTAIIYSLYLDNDKLDSEKEFNVIDNNFWKYLKEEIIEKLYK